MAENHPLDQIIPALIEAKKAMPPIVKDRAAGDAKSSKSEFAYKYAGLDHVLEAVTPALLENHLLLNHELTFGPDGGMLTTFLRHVSGQTLKSEMPFPAMPAGRAAQQWGSNMTYAKRYSVLALLGLSPVHEDDDAGGGRHLRREPIEDDLEIVEMANRALKAMPSYTLDKLLETERRIAESEAFHQLEHSAPAKAREVRDAIAKRKRELQPRRPERPSVDEYRNPGVSVERGEHYQPSSEMMEPIGQGFKEHPVPDPDYDDQEDRGEIQDVLPDAELKTIEQQVNIMLTDIPTQTAGNLKGTELWMAKTIKPGGPRLLDVLVDYLPDLHGKLRMAIDARKSELDVD